MAFELFFGRRVSSAARIWEPLSGTCSVFAENRLRAAWAAAADWCLFERCRQKKEAARRPLLEPSADLVESSDDFGSDSESDC